ncbi:transmembrane protein 141-like isoform X2 [Cloeon dipterum]|uniref:transmembrane protein 141-like isoform X2 n=1 Tax=Cloeon dipterum TaxID=197152 RepID=UPI00321F8E81
MNNVNQLKQQYSGTHPGIGSYLECMTRALLTGLSTFTLTFACVYVPQNILKKRLPYGPGGKILSSTILASATAYYITSKKSKLCQAGWLAVEEKHTYFTEQEKLNQEE